VDDIRLFAFEFARGLGGYSAVVEYGH